MTHLTSSPVASEPQALRLGILGCANIARQFVRDTKGSTAVQVVAVASRQLETAVAFAGALDVARAHGSYEALLADGAVDAIYLPLPNSLHAEWAIRAAEAGKHVLCEKPLSLGVAQARRMFDAAERHGVQLLEAYPYAFQPQNLALLGLLNQGVLGEVRSVQACFGFTVAQGSGNIRLQPELGGGALLDAGSYALSLIRSVMGCAPQRVRADASWSDSGVDISTSATLYYADGRRAQLSCAMDTANHRRATVVGSLGTLETEYLNHTAHAAGDNPFGYLPSQLRLRRGVANSIPFEEISCPSGSGFRFAAETFAQALAHGDRALFERARQSSLDNMATLEALALSAREDRAVALDGL